MREAYEEDDNTSYDAMYLGSPGIPESATSNEKQYIERVKDLSSQESSLQPLPRRDLPPSTQTAAPRGVQTASVDPSVVAAQRPQSIAASGGISSIDPERAKLAFGPFDILTARNGGEIRSGIGGLFR